MSYHDWTNALRQNPYDPTHVSNPIEREYRVKSEANLLRRCAAIVPVLIVVYIGFSDHSLWVVETSIIAAVVVASVVAVVRSGGSVWARVVLLLQMCVFTTMIACVIWRELINT